MTKVIYALFDDGNQSVKKALEPLGYEVYSFGIQKKDTVINCDLTNVSDFFHKVSGLPKPDFIFANPPCNTFVIDKGVFLFYNEYIKLKQRRKQMKVRTCSNCLRLFEVPDDYKEQRVELCCYECCKEYRGY